MFFIVIKYVVHEYNSALLFKFPTKDAPKVLNF